MFSQKKYEVQSLKIKLHSYILLVVLIPNLIRILDIEYNNVWKIDFIIKLEKDLRFWNFIQ